MFSGIVEEMGIVRTTRELEGARELEIGGTVVLEDLEPLLRLRRLYRGGDGAEGSGDRIPLRH